MEVSVLNGGFSRQSSGKSYKGSPMNGFNRVNALNGRGYQIGETYVMNGVGYTLNGVIDDMPSEMLAELIVDAQEGDIDAIQAFESMNGLRDWLRKRKQIREQKRQNRQMKKDSKLEKKDARIALIRAKVDRIKSGGGLGSKIGEVAKSLIDRAGSAGNQFVDMAQSGLADIGLQDIGEMDERGLFGPPSLFKNPGKWFSSKRVPTWQKIAVGVGVGIGLDKALNKGKMTKKILKF